MSQKVVKICVIGSGIIGLTSAQTVQEFGQNFGQNFDITLIAEKFSPDTTSDGAGGLWGPYLLGDTPEDLIRKCSMKTHEILENFWKCGEADRLGITMVPVSRVSEEENFSPPFWKDIVYGFSNLTQKELEEFGNPKFKKGYSFVTYTMESKKMLPHLLEQFIQNGGKILHQKVENLEFLAKTGGFDILINCSGIGANQLVGDNLVQPKRGQVIRVEAPWINRALIDDSYEGTNHIIPNQDSILLGGTHQDGNWSRVADPIDRKFIRDGCEKLCPNLNGSKVLWEWVGLRPGRPSLRLEMETKIFPGKNKPTYVIHNYGHSGSGITLSFGCAQQVSEFVQKAVNEMQEISKLKLKSKL